MPKNDNALSSARKTHSIMRSVPKICLAVISTEGVLSIARNNLSDTELHNINCRKCYIERK